MDAEIDDQMTTTSNSAEAVNEPSAKRSRRLPARFKVEPPHPFQAKHKRAVLNRELKTWSESSLKLWSEYIQWNWDASSEEIATAIGKDKESVERLKNLILENQWRSESAQAGVGSGILINKTDDALTVAEKPLDFWHQLSATLTPPELNDSYQLSYVMQDIATKSSEDYAAIYEYFSIIMDDPSSTINMQPKLTGLQAGIVLEILHGIALAVKDINNVQPLLRKRALAVIEGDWEMLKMPIRTDLENPIPANMMKRASLQCLNPFAMPRDALPEIVCEPPSNKNQRLSDVSAAIPQPTSLRSLSSRNKVNNGYKTMIVEHNVPRLKINSRDTHVLSTADRVIVPRSESGEWKRKSRKKASASKKPSTRDAAQ